MNDKTKEVEIRYPDDFHMPAREEAEEAFAVAAEIKAFITARLDAHSNDAEALS